MVSNVENDELRQEIKQKHNGGIENSSVFRVSEPRHMTVGVL